MNAPSLAPIDTFLSRLSLSGSFQGPPGPTAPELRQILGAAQRAADHGRLRPWRFTVVHPAQYGAFYDELAAAATRVQGDPARLAANREKYRLVERSPLMIIAAAKIDPAHKVAPIEQQFAAAGAAQLVLSAAHALGYAAFLFSGAGVFDAPLKAQLGLGPQDHLIGFICIGTAAAPGKAGPSAEALVREGLSATVSQWQGPGALVPWQP